MPAPNPTPETPSEWPDRWVLLALLAGGLALRLILAARTFLNPDEALHYWLSVQPSLRLAYQASLSTAHPPLLILFLYFWRVLGHSEFVLRLPSVVAGMGFAWLAFKWLARIANRRVATFTLILLLFSPSLIALTAEVRQYSFLLLFISASLYFFDRAIIESACVTMALSGTALLLALLTHYSAFLIALSLGIYGLVRLYPLRNQMRLTGVWIATQIVCLGICGYLFVPHIAALRSQGVVQDIADTWLRASIFHPGEESWLFFLGRQTLRLFRYLFGQPAVGPLGLTSFVCGIAALFRSRQPSRLTPSSRQLGILLTAPLLINIALSRVYPYGGTRHNSFLALFAMAAVGFALDALRSGPKWWIPAVLIAILVISNISPSPGGPYIRPQDQQKQQMHQAMDFLRNSVAPGATVLSDYQGALVLGYYLCGARVVLVESSSDPFPQSACGSYRIVTTDAHRWSFNAKDFPLQLSQMATEHHMSRESELWLFQTGWGIASDHEWPKTLANAGCNQAVKFGRDISVCRIRASDSAHVADIR
jgi:4-amino-4-deoxy-L-arabinose transferase-like glycosyltransferase